MQIPPLSLEALRSGKLNRTEDQNEFTAMAMSPPGRPSLSRLYRVFKGMDEYLSGVKKVSCEIKTSALE